MGTLSLTTHFTFTETGTLDDDYTITGGSTTAGDTITITNYKDQTYSVAGTTLVTLWDDSDNVNSFVFCWIDSDVDVEIQFVCNEGGTTGGSNLAGGFVIKLKAGVPFVLPNDDSRNHGDAVTHIDSWETNWNADTIDRIECYNATGGAAKVRIFIGK